MGYAVSVILVFATTAQNRKVAVHSLRCIQNPIEWREPYMCSHRNDEGNGTLTVKVPNGNAPLNAHDYCRGILVFVGSLLWSSSLYMACVKGGSSFINTHVFRVLSHGQVCAGKRRNASKPHGFATW